VFLFFIVQLSNIIASQLFNIIASQLSNYNLPGFQYYSFPAFQYYSFPALPMMQVWRLRMYRPENSLGAAKPLYFLTQKLDLKKGWVQRLI